MMSKKKLFGKYAKNAGEMERAVDGRKPEQKEKPPIVIHERNKDPRARLAYYRAHGLTNCDGYPGGDAAFVRDVLSGEHRDSGFCEAPLKREDYYVLKYMLDGRFVPDFDFFWEFHPRACMEHLFCFRHGIQIQINLLPGQENPFLADMRYCEFDVREYCSHDPWENELEEKRGWKQRIKNFWKGLTHWKM